MELSSLSTMINKKFEELMFPTFPVNDTIKNVYKLKKKS